MLMKKINFTHFFGNSSSSTQFFKHSLFMIKKIFNILNQGLNHYTEMSFFLIYFDVYKI